ncbi:hemerythrin domain-containing protein [Mycobacterium sp.]|uniref:hemerythrin domain-containing protein n=1 Tax=Mycobacterium sp. TaxID=1785 RepID=UPI002D594846|nr:hemerythrin domain-containing protein [Mycobacterium sp.]HZA09631.1 hemerythrin domain-containing protein [Mycobacterium sp.]
MTADTQPADTRMMGIVHNALRRDIARAESALTHWPYPDPSQRAAIGKHLVWMMQFLHGHHRTEDDGLYPLVRQRVPQAAQILDAMDADHHALMPAIDKLIDKARCYIEDPSARIELVTALNELAAVMLPHLQREETEMLPVVSAAVTKAEWDAIEQAYAVSPLKPAELAFTALWLFDEASEEDRAVVRSVVPKPVAWAIETFTTRSYQRRAWRCWYLPQHTRLRRKTSGQVSVEVAAPIEAVWKVVADPVRTPEFSHECRRVKFLAGATPAALGRRFRGTNRSGRYRWSRTCTVFTYDEPREFGYITSGGPGDATAWHFRLEPTAAGTRLNQAFQGVSMPLWLSRLVAVLIPAHVDRTDALRGDMMRLAALAEAEHQHGADRPAAGARW